MTLLVEHFPNHVFAEMYTEHSTIPEFLAFAIHCWLGEGEDM